MNELLSTGKLYKLENVNVGIAVYSRITPTSLNTKVRVVHLVTNQSLSQFSFHIFRKLLSSY